jgi:hypothetical protein
MTQRTTAGYGATYIRNDSMESASGVAEAMLAGRKFPEIFCC